MSEERPLVLDVDGTFLRTDMLYECFWGGLGRDPILRTDYNPIRMQKILNRRALAQELGVRYHNHVVSAENLLYDSR